VLDEDRGILLVISDCYAHHPEGGLGSAVTDALVTARPGPLSITRLAVDGMPGSGSGEELLAWAGINAASITQAALALTRSEAP